MESITELHCRGGIWAAEQAYNAPSATMLDCNWAWWQAAYEYFNWTIEEASANVSGFMWGNEFSALRGW